MHNTGINVWYPSQENNYRAQGIMNNLQNGLIPEEKVIPALIQVLNYRPHQKNCLEYITDKFSYTQEAIELANYYGLEDDMGV